MNWNSSTFQYMRVPLQLSLSRTIFLFLSTGVELETLMQDATTDMEHACGKINYTVN